ncbi:MAG: DNA alkylation repair protein [Candidatus Caenarcaniphilales bacterium]|nr:DNA alkylation repair protein [Candidatus Caenarcaniphilales bacterium]
MPKKKPEIQETAKTTKRKGARSMAEIPPEVLEILNSGKIETANLMEWLAVDQKRLLEVFLKQNKRQEYLEPIILKLKDLDSTGKATAGKKSAIISAELLQIVYKEKDEELLKLLSHHRSDTVRCWAAFMIGNDENLSLAEMFEKIEIFADDKHFGVRELAWLTTRPRTAKELKASIKILTNWAKDKAEGSRRFASEITRPRGVWCKHINELKENPSLALPILEPLKTDSSKYVCDSVGNWLNDAAKSNPEWVLALCEKWLAESNSKETQYIIKKAKRSL